MIKINELRIGNRILDPFGKEAEVMKINSRGTVALSAVNGDYECESFNLNSHPCMPITLTEELLEKMGAKPSYNAYYVYGKRIHFIEGVWLHYATRVKLPYAHTLQNFIFALTGEELEIKEANNE